MIRWKFITLVVVVFVIGLSSGVDHSIRTNTFNVKVAEILMDTRARITENKIAPSKLRVYKSWTYPLQILNILDDIEQFHHENYSLQNIPLKNRDLAYFIVGRQWINQDNRGEAIYWWKTLSLPREYFLNTTKFAVTLGDYKRAINLLHVGLSKYPDESTFYEYLGKIYGDYILNHELAILFLTQSLENGSSDSQILKQIGIHHSKLGHTRLAIEYLTNAISESPDIDTLIRIVILHRQLGECEQAIELLDGYQLLGESSAEFFAQKALAFLCLNEEKSADEMLTYADEIESNNLSVLGAKGNFFLHYGDFIKANRVALDMLKIDSRNAWAFSILGRSQLGSGQCRQAIESFKNATSITPNQISLIIALAESFHCAGFRGSAIDLLEETLLRDQQSENATVILELLEDIRQLNGSK